MKITREKYVDNELWNTSCIRKIMQEEIKMYMCKKIDNNILPNEFDLCFTHNDGLTFYPCNCDVIVIVEERDNEYCISVLDELPNNIEDEICLQIRVKIWKYAKPNSDTWAIYTRNNGE